jgi:hypothetical protein
MGAQVEDKPRGERRVVVADSWRTQFFECKEIGPEPPLNATGFWRKPKHGILKEDKGG